MEGCRVLGFQGCRALVLELFLLTNGTEGFYIPKRFRKPHFSEVKGSRIPVFEFFRGLNFFEVVALNVSGFEGWRIVGF